MTNAAVLGEVLTDTPTGELVAAVSAALDEPGWLLKHRLAALSAYHALQWPSGQEEEWRRTPMTDVPLERYRLPLNGQSGTDEGASPVSLDALRVDQRGGLVEHLDDSVTRAEIAAELNDRGVLLLPLSTAAREHEELVRQHLNSVVPYADDRFAALSGALWSQGLFCYVPRNVVVEPTLVHRLGKSTGGRGLFGHTLVVAEDGASVTLLEAAASDDAESPSFCQRTVEVIVKDNAQVRLVGLQRWGNDVHSFVTERARLGHDAKVLLASVAFGGALSKERIEVVLAGDGSNADLIALFVGGGQQHIEYNTRQDHLGVGSSSDLLIKGVLTGQA
ncbi:MAG: SufD family Fe-S cluster assembly protein, partial [Dehalococcoidia bacterium]